jgi:hypothetical protein
MAQLAHGARSEVGKGKTVWRLVRVQDGLR